MILLRITMTTLVLLLPYNSFAHHVLGRPSYSLNESSNTPPSMQVETRIGKYYVTYMVFPAFPKPKQQGRINLYIKKIKDGVPFKGEVVFTVLDDSWFSSNKEVLGAQYSNDAIFRQGFIFQRPGYYLVRAEFISDKEPYIVDFPLRIGNPWPLGPIGLMVGIIVIMLLVINLKVRYKLQRLQAVRHREEKNN
ncbi:FIG00921845: hypothetical protein [hydrothermal vent metagenome]|uniref:Uncharacterized protein n=1 Tax=hydrothermal vent metagenome TaxID=652676 RepID=A0A3B0Z4R4_9ZZZZ